MVLDRKYFVAKFLAFGIFSSTKFEPNTKYKRPNKLNYPTEGSLPLHLQCKTRDEVNSKCRRVKNPPRFQSRSEAKL